MAFGTLVFGHFEHKIGNFVRFGGATAGAMAGSNGSNESNESNGSNVSNVSNVSNWSNGSNGNNENNRSNRNNGATGTTAGTVWVADILSQLGFVWTLALYLTLLVVSSDISSGA